MTARMDPNDPNTGLEIAREITAAILADPDNWDEIDAAALGEAFEALDQWLTKGGVLPHAWSRPPLVIVPKSSPKLEPLPKLQRDDVVCPTCGWKLS